MRYAGFGRRLVAHVIDHVIVALAAVLVLAPVTGATLLFGVIETVRESPAALIGLVFSAIGIVAAAAAGVWVYSAGFESSSWQATPGKRLMGLIVTDEQGRRITFSRASVRYFAKWVSALALHLGYVIALFTARKQTLHDLLASTLVLERVAF